LDAAGGELTKCGGSDKEDGNKVEEGCKTSVEAEECEEKGNDDSWYTTSREIYIWPVGI